MTNPKEPNPDQLLADIKNSIGDMQNQMQSKVSAQKTLV